MQILKTIGGIVLIVAGLALIIAIEYAVFGLPGGPGYNLIHEETNVPSFALFATAMISILSLMLGAMLIVPGIAILSILQKNVNP